MTLAVRLSLAVNFNDTTTKTHPKGNAISDTDCSQCTGNGPCAPCSSCVDMKTGPCEPCWSDDNPAGQACLPACSSCYGSSSSSKWASYINGRVSGKTGSPAVKASTCEAITDEKTCMSSSEGSEACAWCSSGAVGTSCQKESEAKQLPSAVFECEYQTAYAAYTTTSDNDNAGVGSTSKQDTPQLSSTAECNTYNYLKKAGFPQSSLATMVCISKYESSWNCHATNKNVDGSTDYGLMQINSYYWCSGDPTSKYDECHATCDSLYDCQKNANCAYIVYRQQGYNAWYGYKNHKTECDNYQVYC